MRVRFGVLGPVTAWDDGVGGDGDGDAGGGWAGVGVGGDGGVGSGAIALKGPRHRAVLARLIVARRRVVPVNLLVDDLWTDPPADAVGAVRTFVAALRRGLEPARPPRAPARLLVTQGPGYALRAEPDAVDAWCFETAMADARALPPRAAAARLAEALGWWRGPAYAEFTDLPWARTERSRLAELRLHAVERHARARLSLGLAAETAADLDGHVAAHPWREDAWRLLALALYRAGRQADALAVLRRARTMLGEQLGVDPGPALRRLETDILTQADHLEAAEDGGEGWPGAEAPGAGAYGKAGRPGTGAGPDAVGDDGERGDGETAGRGSAGAGGDRDGAGPEEGRPEAGGVPKAGGSTGVAGAPGRGSGGSGGSGGDDGAGRRGSARADGGAGPVDGAPGRGGGRGRGGGERGGGAGPKDGRPEAGGVPEDGGRVGAAVEPERGGGGSGRDGGAGGRRSAGTGGDAGPAPGERGAPDAVGGGEDGARRVWAEAAAAYDRAVAPGARARLESTVGLLRNLAVTGGGGLQAARRHRVAAVVAAEELGDPELAARVIGAYDVPAIWTRVDDPAQATRVVAAAERALATLPPTEHAAARARLLATVAVESRGTRSARGPQAARQAERLARRLDDPALLAFALNGVFMQTFERTGLAAERDRIGAELVGLSARHGLVTYEVLGHLVRMQARGALADFPGADAHAAAADGLAERHELPLVAVFTRWYAALRLAETAAPAPPPSASSASSASAADAAPAASATSAADAAFRAAADRLDGAGMPGLERGLLPLALLCLRLRPGLAVPVDEAVEGATDTAPAGATGTGWGPYEPWVRPLVLLAEGRRAEAAKALRAVPEPPRDLMLETAWCLVARAAVELGDRETMARARDRLTPAAAELAGAGTGLLTLGPVADHLATLTAALGTPPRA